MFPSSAGCSGCHQTKGQLPHLLCHQREPTVTFVSCRIFLYRQSLHEMQWNARVVWHTCPGLEEAVSTSAGEERVCMAEQKTEDKLPFDTACRELVAAKLPALSCPERLLMKRSLVESLCVVLECVQRGGWGGPPEAQHKGHPSGFIGLLPPGSPMDAACSPSPKGVPQPQCEEERPRLQPWCNRRAQL